MTLTKVWGGRVKHFKADYRSHKEMFRGLILIHTELKYCDFLPVFLSPLFQGTNWRDLFSLFARKVLRTERLIIVIFHRDHVADNTQIFNMRRARDVIHFACARQL